MNKFIDLIKALLKVKESWKFYGILFFLAFVIYLIFGNGAQQAMMLKDAVFQEPVSIQSAAPVK